MPCKVKIGPANFAARSWRCLQLESHVMPGDLPVSIVALPKLSTECLKTIWVSLHIIEDTFQ